MTLVWCGEEAVVRATNQIGAVLKAGSVTPALLRAHAATAQLLAKAAGMKGATDADAARGSFDFVEKPDEARAVEVLRGNPAKTPVPAREAAIRDLAQTTNAAGLALLQRIALRASEPAKLRCAAIVALAGDSAAVPALLSLLEDASLEVKTEAARVLRPAVTDDRVRRAFTVALSRAPDPVREQIAYALAPASAARPASDDEWRKELNGAGDVARGERIFFNPSTGCARCHRIEDHGGRLGPDLSTIARGSNREKLMLSILHPSRDIAPQFVSHTVETRDGQAVSGLLLSQNADGTVILATAEGKAVRIPASDVVTHTQSKVSLMPEDLAGTMTVRDFRDLMAYLLSRK